MSTIYVQTVKSTDKYHNSFQRGPGEIPDISHIVMFYWFEPFLYLDPVAKFPETTEKPGFFVGFEDNLGMLICKDFHCLCTSTNWTVISASCGSLTRGFEEKVISCNH
jgi:hypothetical protein